MPARHPVKATATFRCYAELNDFLAPARRGREFATPCARVATVKHMLEALGVPHTEVELLLVNGVPAGFDQRLQDGDRVAAYPHCAALDVTPLLRGRAWPRQPSRPLRFVADCHLGGLARLLRMAGFDTLFRNDYADRALADLSIEDGRILLTRDRELLKRRGITQGCYVHALQPPLQFRELAVRLDLAPDCQPFSLCLECNAPLRPVEKQEVIDRLPPAVRLHQTRFVTCDLCRRVYWEGSHWRRMQALLARSLPAGDPVGRVAFMGDTANISTIASEEKRS